ncbi:hypothetical protein [Sphingobacterium paucimobilis]|uniref:Uncharacterized protein n=1 Tax=Sphingobacterium paucimobilis HER1398 TaxID=1346330 RepID=U2J4N6_9SPHI|nr:hypothetical protein [Sphingobacterium paucimobilis]ERJ59914.1 hypothetical protein M472_14180 [Sphingobacterium paucimobilis HER1398]
MNVTNYFITALSVSLLTACNSGQQEQILEQLDKKSAREVTLKTVTQGDSVLHITSQHIWYNGEQIASKNDTIKTLAAPNTWDGIDSTKTLSKVPIYVTVQ